jgi:two-component system sensor histidine kinase BarA
MVAGISLANKCQLLFGFAVIVILTCALAVPWSGARVLVRDYDIEVARQIADAWLSDRIQLGNLDAPGSSFLPAADGALILDEGPLLQLTFLRLDDIDDIMGDPSDEPSFIIEAVGRFREDPELDEHTATVTVDGRTVVRYARAIHESEMRSVRDFSVSIFSAPVFEPEIGDPLRAVLIVDRTNQFARSQLLRSQILIISALIAGGLTAILVFYFILTKLILSPVRKLRRTAEKVQQGDLSIRSEIRTRDEFEQLADAFNLMLDRLDEGREQLRRINENLDLKVDELAEANIGLFESNRLKSEFLANVSHELRTPLNSIIGFAELLDDIARSEENVDPKRQRYLENILTSGKSLLAMINDLLDMAKIEAGRIDISIDHLSVSDLIEGLVGIMGPQARAQDIELRTVIAANVPKVETDPGKLQQILYNFLSNAIKFTPKGGSITLSADRVTRQDNTAGVRLAVADTGPGIPEDMQDVVFEKFRQIDAGHTRRHMGTGLGLAICRELAHLIGASVSFVSETGRGATFFVDLPLNYRPDEPQPLMP